MAPGRRPPWLGGRNDGQALVAPPPSSAILAGSRDELGVRARVPAQSPATLGRFGEQDPGAVGDRRIARRDRHHRCQLGDHGQPCRSLQPV